MRRAVLAPLFVACLLSAEAGAEQPSITVAATTSFVDSGLAGALVPKFTAAAGVKVELISRGSGEDILLLQKGLVDVVLVNDPAAVARIRRAGHVEPPRRFMANKLMIAGPASDPAEIRGLTDLPAALRSIAYRRAPFVSRADSSGTYQAEQGFWKQAGVDPATRSGTWYRDSGLGMRETLQIAARLQAYVLTDRATWLASPDKHRLPLVLEPQGEPDNHYEVMVADPGRYAGVKAKEARAFVDWLTSSEGQSAIGAYERDGEAPFTPTALPGG